MVNCLRVPKCDGESVRSELMAQGLLDLSHRISSDGGDLLIPVLCDSFGDYPVEEADAAEQGVRPKEYREVVKDVPDGLRELLPVSFDVVGDIAMIRIPDELLPYSRQIGEALIEVNRNIRAAFSDSGVKGEFRIRDLEKIAGEGGSETVHKEFGVRLFTDPSKVYFNPRLSSERSRIAGLVEDGEVIIDMFGGVAPFGTVIGKLAHPSAIYSIDLNPAAEEFACRNARKNGVKVLHPMTGDSSKVVYTLPEADRIIMNLPQIADRFLCYAMDRLKVGGTVHMYKILERSEFEGFERGLAEDMASRGFGIRISSFELKTYSPTMSVYSLDIQRVS